MNTQELASQPLFFEKNRVSRVYTGGKLFADFFGDDSTDGFYPEEWICSSTKALNNTTDRPEGLSLIKGTNIYFADLINEQKELMLGKGKTGFNVLVKALDSAIRLPVQAHPDKAFSRKHFNCEFGKAESWLVLAVREGASIFFGFKDGVTADTFKQAVEDAEKDSTAMERLLNKIPVKPGDVYFIPPKAVHAIGYGCLILEVQEPTDFTIQPERRCGEYRLSDEEMYLSLSKETALSVFDYSYNSARVEAECKKTPETVYETNGCKKECLIGKSDTHCFGLERFTLNCGETEKLTAPCIYVVTDGQGILCGEKYEKQLKKGDYFFMPYSCKNKFTVKSNSRLTLAACLPPEE